MFRVHLLNFIGFATATLLVMVATPATAVTRGITGGCIGEPGKSFDQKQFVPDNAGSPYPEPGLNKTITSTNLDCSATATGISGRGFVGGHAGSDKIQDTQGVNADSSFNAFAEYELHVSAPGDWDRVSDIPFQVVACADATLDAVVLGRPGGQSEVARAQANYTRTVRGNSIDASDPPTTQTSFSTFVQADGNPSTALMGDEQTPLTIR